MAAEQRLKKLRGSGGYVVASVTDDQQRKGNLGGPDLFLAPVGRLDAATISKYYCNTCERDFEGAPRIDYESPNEAVADNLVLAEKGQYVCGECESTIAEYRQFTKPDESAGAGLAVPEGGRAAPPAAGPGQAAGAPPPAGGQAAGAAGVRPIDGMEVYDEDGVRVGWARHAGVDASQSLVLVVAGPDGAAGSVPWSRVKKVGEIILLGGAGGGAAGGGACAGCGFANKPGSKFCEQCGAKA